MNSPRLCSILSALAIITAPVVAMIGAFEINYLLMGSLIFIIGAFGLYAGMRGLE